MPKVYFDYTQVNSELDQIPREDLIAMLKERVWYSGNREEFKDKQGYSLYVNEETAIRDVVYRDWPLYATPEEAILEEWKRSKKKYHVEKCANCGLPVYLESPAEGYSCPVCGSSDSDE